MNRKRSEMEIVLAAEDKGISKIRGVSGTLARLWRLILIQNNIKLNIMDAMLNLYVRNSANGIPNNKRDQISARGNLTKEIFKPILSWKVFCKALKFIGARKFELSVKIYYYDGKTSQHSTMVNISGPNSDGVNEQTSDNNERMVSLNNNYFKKWQRNDMSTNSNILYRPEDDGVTHCNIWLHGQTKLGKMLSHFYECPFKHPVFGHFTSMEGFWQYIQVEESESDIIERRELAESLRYLVGMAAKKKGSQLTWRRVDKFHEIINAANYYKINQHPELRQLFIESELPFSYYYVHTPKGELAIIKPRAITPPGYEWLVDGFEENRRMMRDGILPNIEIYTHFMKT